MRRLALCLAALLAGCGAGGGGVDRSGLRIIDTQVDSAAVGETLDMRIVVPPGGAEGRPLVVFLHGRGGSPQGSISAGFVRGYEALGEAAPVVAFPAGGEASYWHDRDDGDWGRYVLEEVIAHALERTGADGGRVALGGISMGGFGALDLAQRARRELCAVGAHSPAIFASAQETPEGAFDDAQDFAAHDVIAAADRMPDAPLWLDIGTEDPLRPGAEAFAAAAGERLRLAPGGHDGDYWGDRWPAYLRFYARACS